MLTNQTRAALVHLLESISPSGLRLLFLKHMNLDQQYFSSSTLHDLAVSASPDEMTGLLVEVVGGATAIRADAPSKKVFDARVGELRQRLRTDGFDIVGDALIRLMPGAEPAAQISDFLQDALAASDLDDGEGIRRVLRESHSSMSASPPDLNDATTKARIALETVARVAASRIAAERGKDAPSDKWGSALCFLRVEGVISQTEEEAFAGVYKLISSGAHVPKGLTDEQWAMLSRAFALAGAYFLTQQYLAA